MGRHAHSRAGQSPVTQAALILVLVVAVAGVGWVAFRPNGSEAGSDDECGGTDPVVVSVVPSMEQVMAKAVEGLRAEDECFPAMVRAETPAAVEDSFFNGGRPDLWLADSTARVERLHTIGISTTEVSPSIAVSPIGLAGGPSADEPESWLAAFESGQLLMSDPEVDGDSALALVAPTLEQDLTGADPERTEAAIVNAAQDYGARMTEAGNDEVSLTEISATFPRLIPASEQELLTQGQGVASLKVLTPETGVPALTFPLVMADGGAKEAPAVGEAIAEWFKSDAGREVLAEAGLRGSDGAAISGRGLGDVTIFEEPPAEEFNAVLGSWNVLSVPSSLLAVFDASGSMDFPAGNGKTRMDLAVEAALTALDVFPPHARIGLWAFSIEQGGPDQDWRELAPMRRLNDKTEGVSHYEYLRTQVPVLKGLTQGGTGLFDTTLAAYKKAQKVYDPAFFNAVIIMSDGANDDPGSVSLNQLIEQLENAQDPDRPVRIIAVGISSDADMPSLTKIAEATGGQAYPAEDPNDILDVFAQALMSR